MSHETASKSSIGLTNEEMKKLIKILNHEKIDELIRYDKENSDDKR